MSKSKLKTNIEKYIVGNSLQTIIDCAYPTSRLLEAYTLLGKYLFDKELGKANYVSLNPEAFSLEFSRKATKAEILEDKSQTEEEDECNRKNRISSLKSSAKELGFSLIPLK